MPNDVAKKLLAVLEPLVGSVLAGVSLDLESKRIGKTPDTITTEDLPQIAENLQRQLRLVVGSEVATRAADRVANILV